MFFIVVSFVLFRGGVMSSVLVLIVVIIVGCFQWLVTNSVVKLKVKRGSVKLVIIIIFGVYFPYFYYQVVLPR